MRTATLLALTAALAAAPAAAQINPYLPPAASTAPAIVPISLGTQLSPAGGPWVLGEVLFFQNGQVTSDYTWSDKVHGTPGQLYTSGDLQSDVQSLMSLGAFERVAPAVYAIPNDPVPPQFSSIAVSSDQIRVVFTVVPKPAPKAPVVKLVPPPSAVSGLILTPTAFRGAGEHNTPGLGLDINAAYFIGRLYGKNSYPDSPSKTNYIDRIGLWLLTADGKMQIQSDAGWRPAVAVGGQATMMFRDSPQPTVTTPGVSVKVDAKSTKVLTDGYIVASKDWRGVRASLGLMQGNFGDLPTNLSEFLTPEALRFYKGPASVPVADVTSRTMPFGSVFYMLKPDYPVGVEYIKFNGAFGKPTLIDFKLGRLLHLNFDVALLKFDGGYDVLGLFQFRYNHFPRR